MNQLPIASRDSACAASRRTSQGLRSAWAGVASGQNRDGFTLLEMIGVLAVMAIISALMAPVVVQSLDLAVRNREVSELGAMAAALQSGIPRQGRIPDPNPANTPPDLQNFVATEMGVSLNQVTNNSRNIGRVFVDDPNASLFGFRQLNAPNVRPNWLTSPPGSLRLLIISSLSERLPDYSSIKAAFDLTWTTPDKTKPSGGVWTSWAGAGEDLIIQRVDLTPLFHRAILNNPSLTSSPRPKFSIESGGMASSRTSVTNISDLWFLDNTVLCLYDKTNNLQVKAVVRQDASYFFQTNSSFGIWSGGF